MRIGLVAPPWVPVPPSTYGGTEAVVDNLARSLAERGHEVALFTVGTSTCPVERRHLFGASAEPMNSSLPEAAHVLAAHAELAGLDLVHDHTVLGPLLAPGGRGPRPGRHQPRGLRPVGPAGLRGGRAAGAVVAISADQARRAAGVPIAAVIHHGIDLEVYRPGGRVGTTSSSWAGWRTTRGCTARCASRTLRPPNATGTKMRTAEEIDYFPAEVAPLLSAEDTARGAPGRGAGEVCAAPSHC